VLISALATAAIFAVIFGILAGTVFKDDFFPSESTPSESTSVPSAPEVDEIGSVDSEKVESVKLYAVPNFKGKTYAEVIDNKDNKNFKIVLKNKTYSNSYAKGQVCKQSVAKGKEVEKNTKIELTISLGAKDFKMPKLSGLSETGAKLELLKLGFLYDNIEVLKKHDENSEPGVILDQNPAYGEKVNGEIKVQIYINSYQGEEPMGGGDDDEILSQIIDSTN
jgi:beta-lactam-binding protein with PASTA domain